MKDIKPKESGEVFVLLLLCFPLRGRLSQMTEKQLGIEGGDSEGKLCLQVLVNTLGPKVTAMMFCH